MPSHYRTGTETIEIAARRHFFAAAPDGFGCAILEVPGTPATLMSVHAMPSPMMNRVVGLAGDVPLAAETLAQIRQAFSARAIPQFWLHAWNTPDHDVLRDSLLALGCQPQGALALCECALDQDLPVLAPVLASAAAVSVRLARPDEYGLAGQILYRSFGMWPVLEQWMAALAGRPDWQVFLACDDDGTPVGTGTLLVDGPHAWLGMGATLPTARRRGAQQALLAARLAGARAAGCTTANVEAEAAPPGESSPSLNNILRAGFRQIGTRQNYLFDS